MPQVVSLVGPIQAPPAVALGATVQVRRNAGGIPAGGPVIPGASGGGGGPPAGGGGRGGGPRAGCPIPRVPRGEAGAPPVAADPPQPDVVVARGLGTRLRRNTTGRPVGLMPRGLTARLRAISV